LRDQVLLLGLGFLFTTVAGGSLGAIFQRRAWSHQHGVGVREAERTEALKTFEAVSTLMDARLYRMRLVYWAARDRLNESDGFRDLDGSWAEYQAVLYRWNDGANRNLALVEAHFGAGVRMRVEVELYQEFRTLHPVIYELVRAAKDGRQFPELPTVGRRLALLERRVYTLNLRMLELIRDEDIGSRAPKSDTVCVRAAEMGVSLGDDGEEVRRLQHALRRRGHYSGAVDGHFDSLTDAALRAFQEIHNLGVDGIAGDDTWSALRS
jgi:hypothetical protein